MQKFDEEVAGIFKRESDHKAQLESLSVLLDNAFPTSNEVNSMNLLKLVQAVVNLEAGSMVVSRQFISAVNSRLDSSALDWSVTKGIVQQLLEILQSRSISYEEQTCILRMKLADILEKENDLLGAAHALIGISTEASNRLLSPADRMNLLLRIGRFLLTVGQVNEAETYINKASMMQDDKSEGTCVHLKVIYAQLLDMKRKFVEAAQRYFECSLITSIGTSDCIESLGKAITCTILASPGAQRTRMLSTLYKDERSAALPQFELLRKLFLDRLIKNVELEELERSLASHQLEDEKGDSIVRKVILEHNMSAVSRLYLNISMTTLGELLGITPERAEEIAVQMISTNRLPGSIDQIEGFLHFAKCDSLRQWDEQILGLCQQINRVSELIMNEHPNLVVK